MDASTVVRNPMPNWSSSLPADVCERVGQRWLSVSARRPRSQGRLWTGSLGMFLSLLGIMGGIVACAGDPPTTPGILDLGQAYWGLVLNQQAVNMATIAPYNTVQLTATPINVAGTPLTGLGPTIYHPIDSTVTVSATGLMTAHYPTPSGFTSVAVSLRDTIHNITHSDTLLVQVTDTVPQYALATFSIQPVAGDSAKRAFNFIDRIPGPHLNNEDLGRFSWPVRTTNTKGDTVCNADGCPLLVSYTVSNQQVVSIFDPQAAVFQTRDTGHVVLRATTFAYGRTFKDSLAFLIEPELFSFVIMQVVGPANARRVTFSGPTHRVFGVGAIVGFIGDSVPVGVVFDHPEHVDSASYTDVLFGLSYPPTGSGNIAPFAEYPDSLAQYTQAGTRARRFNTPGVYRYHASGFPSDTNEIVILKMQ